LPPLPWIVAGLASVFAAISFLAALLRSAIVHHSHFRLSRARRSTKELPLLEDLLEDPERALLASEALELVAAGLTVACVAVALRLAAPEGGPWTELLLGGLGSVLILVLLLRGLPAALLEDREERFLVRVAHARAFPWRFFLRGGGWLESVQRVVLRLRGLPVEPSPMAEIRDEIRSAVESGERDGLLESQHGRMIERVLRLREADASEIMTPRTDMVAIERSRSLHEAVSLAVEKGLSRLPVYEGTPDHVVGIFTVKDVLPYWSRDAKSPSQPELGSFLRAPVFVHEGKPVGEVLEEFLGKKTHFAIVLDEYGGTAGLVTLEDILEEIVGEIRDEHDRATGAPPELRVLEDRTVEISARLPVSELNLALDLELPRSDDFDTAGGYVVASLGRVPKAGERFVRDAVEFRILDADERRVKRLRVTVLEKSEEQA